MVIEKDRLPVGLTWVRLPVGLTKAAEVFQHQIYRIVLRGAHGHALFRLAGTVAEAVCLRGGFLSCAMLRRSASMRLMNRRGAAKGGFFSRTAPASLDFR